MPKRLFRFLVFIAVFCTADPAAAYIPSGPHLLDLMVQAMGSPTTVAVTQELRIPPAEDTAGAEPIVLDESLFYRIPDAFRSETEKEDRIRITAENEYLLVVDEKILAVTPNAEDRFFLPLLVRNRHLLVDRLMALGLDMEKTALTRFAGRICYRIGNPEQGYLLIDKERLFPLQWVVVPGPENSIEKACEFRYQDWRFFGRTAYPLTIEILSEGILRQKMTVKRVTTDTDFSKDRFAIHEMKTRYPSAFPMPSVDTDMPAADDLKELEETLDRFRKRYE